MAHHLTNAEVENKVAFLVQLNALLTQVSSVVSSNALGSAQKAKLGDLRAATETWLKDVGKVGAPRPSITPGNQAAHSPTTESLTTPTAGKKPASAPAVAAPAAAPAEPSSPADTTAVDNADGPATADAAGTPTAQKEKDGTPAHSSPTTSVKQSPEPPTAAPAAAAAPAPTPTPAPGTSSSFTADVASTHTVTDGRNLVDLIGYLRLLFDNDVPERTRLQAFGKSLVRLLMVRCCSTIMASLQHVVHQTYAVAPARMADAPAGSVAESVEAESGAAEVNSFPASATRTQLPSEPPSAEKVRLFVELAREINVATRALLGCVQLVTSSAVPSDPASARFPMQLCIDVVKQTRRALLYFQSRIEKEELYVLRTHILSAGRAANLAEAVSSLEDVDAAQDVLQQEPLEDVDAHVRARAEAMELLWGPSLTHSVRHIGDVVDPAVKFLVSVAGVRAEGAPAAMVGLKKDAAHDLFTLCGIATPSATPLANTGAARTSATTTAASGLARPPSTSELPSFTTVGANGNAAGAGAVASPVSVSSMPLSPACRAAASAVLTSLGSSFLADYLASVARCSGDSNEGQLLCTRLLADMLDYVATHDVPLLRSVLRHSRWSRPLYEGILNCVVSIQPGVLAAGLDALRLLTMHCPAELGQEVGYLYSNVVLRLLESSNSPHYVKRTIVLHFLTTLMSHTSTVSASTAEGSREVPLILHLYRLYDLNVHAHQLNFVQQFTSALSRIVRAAPKDDFNQDAVVQDQLRRQQEAGGQTTNSSNNNNNNNTASSAETAAPNAVGEAGPSFDGSSAAALSASLSTLSLPAMALHGLVRVVELLTTQAPPEEETGRDVLAALPSIQSREWKLKEQQQVDLFNASPKKALYKMFNVTAEENAIPAAYADFGSQWDHTRLPPLPSEETAKKVEDVVDFLTSVSSLDPEAVAEFLTSPAVFPLHVCAAYLRRLPLAGRSVLEAISELLMRVQLPKEGQRIERLLEYFSAAYFDANDVPGVDKEVFPFKNDTAVFIVVVATVMLNTNIHNPSAGMRLDLKSFRGQLRRCNDDESFADVFVDDIFYSISTHPLESIKSISIDTSASADLASRGAFDMFFVSQEEKRQLAFGVERQRMVSETRQLLQLRTRQDTRPAPTSAWWCAAARDLFLSTWSAVCAVFGPAMYEGTSAPLPVLLQCVRGLQSLLCTAAAFDLSTECTVTLLTLLRMAESTPVRAHCRRAVLVVAATSYAVHFPVRCWVAVCQLMLELRLSATSAAPPLVEDVFTRMESLTRLSVEAEEQRELGRSNSKDNRGNADPTSAAADEAAAASAGEAPAVSDRPTEAIHRALEGVMTTLGGYAVGDVANLSAALVLLRRALEFTRIIHGKRDTDVVYYVNIRDFTDVVVPAYVELIKKHSMSDEGLQVLFECLVEILCTMWLSYSTRRMAAPPGFAKSTMHNGLDSGSFPVGAAEDGSEEAAKGDQTKAVGEQPVMITVDTAPSGFVRCFRCLRSVYDVTLAAGPDGAATLLQMHVLQAVKEVLTRTVHATEVSAEAQHLSLYTMVAAWQQALYPLGMALCDRRTTATEAGSLALLVLRKLVALSGGTGGTLSDRLPPQVRGAVLWLLAQLAYMGGMCGDVDGAQVCVALLSSICTTTLAMSLSTSGGAGGLAGWSQPLPSSPIAALSGADVVTVTRAVAERDALTQQVVSSMEESPAYVVRQTLARLGLLLRCEREQTRAEAVHQLRTLSLQMRPAQVQTFAMDLAEVVLEGAIGHAAHHHKTPITHISLIPFFFYQMPVPASMRRCSRTAFRATLPAALGFLSSELLSSLSGDHLATTAQSIMERCLLPILLSPNSPYQSRFLATRALSQCMAVCLPQNGEPPRPALAQCVLNCVALALYAVRLPLAAVVPPSATFVGRRWLEAPSMAAAAQDWSTYTAAAAQAVRVMDTAEPEWVVRGPTQTFAATATAAAPSLPGSTANTPAAEMRDGEAERSAAPPTRSSKSASSNAGNNGLLLDEPLIEYVNLLAQVLAGVPKELQSVVTSAAANTTSSNEVIAVAVAGGVPVQWSLPRASVLVLLQLTLQAAGTLFAILWRINHPYEMEQYALQALELGREAPTILRNGGLLPHAAIRSVLQAYLELAMLSPLYPTSEVLASTTDIIEAIRQVQGAAQPSSTPPNVVSLAAAAAAASSALAADPAALQRLSPQEQQHVRTCNSGMYQQLAAVLGYLVKLLTGQASSTVQGGSYASSPAPQPPSLNASSSAVSAVGWAQRKEAFAAMAMHPQFFASLVSLLTPTAGTLIVTVRDYFAWYIQHAEVAPTLTAAAAAAATAVPASASKEEMKAAPTQVDAPAPPSTVEAAEEDEEEGPVSEGTSAKYAVIREGRALNGHAVERNDALTAAGSLDVTDEAEKAAVALVDDEESLL